MLLVHLDITFFQELTGVHCEYSAPTPRRQAIPLSLSQSLCPHKAVEQRPRENEPGQPANQTARPEFERAPEVSTCIQRRQAARERCRGDAEGVEERGDKDGEGEVEEEAAVGFEAKDAGADAEEGGRQALKIREDLRRAVR